MDTYDAELQDSTDGPLLTEGGGAKVAPARVSARRLVAGAIGLASGCAAVAAFCHGGFKWTIADGAVSKLYTYTEPDTRDQCAGSVRIGGKGKVEVVNSKDSAGQMHVSGNGVRLHVEGRAYMADTCTDGQYSSTDYSAIPLLGKTFAFDVNLANIGCGCNVAFYFTSMHKNTNPSEFGDYYCDASSLGGVSCAEVDIMEANALAWRSTLHMLGDKVGNGAGFGGNIPHKQTWTAKEYGPGASCIDTDRPFTVSAHFPYSNGHFEGLIVELTQAGSSCEGLTANIDEYPRLMDSLVKDLEEGMTPIVSYWSSKDMAWLDGQESDGEWPCRVDFAQCPHTGPTISSMRISPYQGHVGQPTFVAPQPATFVPMSPQPATFVPMPYQRPQRAFQGFGAATVPAAVSDGAPSFQGFR